MSKYLSRKIQFISLFAMLSVVFIHSYNYKDNFLTPTTSISEGFNKFALFEFFFSNGLLRFAVPLFFIISGYLFYRNFLSIKESYLRKLKNRFKSLFIPYCLWSFLSALFLFALSFHDVLCKTQIIQERVYNGAFSLLTCFINPPAFQLWYIQQLLIFTVISPIIYLVIKKSKGFLIIPFAFLWLLDLHFIINSQALFFYCVGAYFAIFSKEKYVIKKEHPAFTLSISLIWINLSFTITYLAVFNSDNPTLTLVRLFLYKINEIVGIMAVWVLFDHIFKRIIKKKIMIVLSKHIFFIFIMHKPLLHLSYQLALLSNNSDISHLILYICMPISVIAICTITGMCIQKLSKPIYYTLTGGRPNYKYSKLRNSYNK